MGDSVVRAETLRAGSEGTTYDGRTPTMPSEDSRRAEHGITTPVSMISEPPRYLAFYESSEVRIPDSDTVMIVTDCFHQHPTVEDDIVQSATHMRAPQGKYERLSRFLHESLPSREDTERICKASGHPSVLAHEIMTTPYTMLDQEGL
ncbi:MAG: hypothetical protein M1818_006005 [Claussenomyces sp. TS43310]|nr:MAG: hypothetical protein M1818_006005 [Claussenomyces sp. TS43310]